VVDAKKLIFEGKVNEAKIKVFGECIISESLNNCDLSVKGKCKKCRKNYKIKDRYSDPDDEVCTVDDRLKSLLI